MVLDWINSADSPSPLQRRGHLQHFFTQLTGVDAEPVLNRCWHRVIDTASHLAKSDRQPRLCWRQARHSRIFWVVRVEAEKDYGRRSGFVPNYQPSFVVHRPDSSCLRGESSTASVES